MADDYSNFKPVGLVAADDYADFKPVSAVPVQEQGIARTALNDVKAAGNDALATGTGIIGGLAHYGAAGLRAVGMPNAANAAGAFSDANFAQTQAALGRAQQDTQAPPNVYVSPTTQFVAGLAAMPVQIPLMPFTESAGFQAIDNGQSVQQAERQNAAGTGVNAALSAVPFHLGGKIADRIGGGVAKRIAASAATGAGLNAVAGPTTRAASNLITGDSNPIETPSLAAQDIGSGLLFGGLGGFHTPSADAVPKPGTGKVPDAPDLTRPDLPQGTASTPPPDAASVDTAAQPTPPPSGVPDPAAEQRATLALSAPTIVGQHNGPSLTTADQRAQSGLGLTPDVRSAQQRHPGFVPITPGEVSVAAQATQSHPDDVNADAVSALVHAASTNHLAAQHTVNSNASDTGLADALGAHPVEQPAPQLAGDAGERGAAPPVEPAAPEQSASQPGRDTAPEVQVGGEVDGNAGDTAGPGVQGSGDHAAGSGSDDGNGSSGADGAGSEAAGRTGGPGATPVAVPDGNTDGGAVTQNAASTLPVQEVPLSDIQPERGVKQFKLNAGSNGLVDRLRGKFDRTGVAPVQLWRRLNGKLYVISGSHRRQLAEDSGEQTIPAQVHNESDGFTPADAATLDAVLNIRDGQGTAADYANYFKHAGLSAREAEQQGLLRGAKHRQAFAIATEGSPATFAAHRAGQLSDQAAAQIAHAAPKNEALQNLGVQQVQAGKPIADAVNTMHAVEQVGGDTSGAQGDMFGLDDSAMQKAQSMAREASKRQRAIREQIAAVQGAAKRPEKARSLGVNVDDPEAVKASIAQLKQQASQWDNWWMHPDLVKDIGSDGVGRTSGPDAPKPEEVAGNRPDAAQGIIATPAPEGSGLTGRELPADEAAAADQQSLLDQPHEARGTRAVESAPPLVGIARIKAVSKMKSAPTGTQIEHNGVRWEKRKDGEWHQVNGFGTATSGQLADFGLSLDQQAKVPTVEAPDASENTKPAAARSGAPDDSTSAGGLRSDESDAKKPTAPTRSSATVPREPRSGGVFASRDGASEFSRDARTKDRYEQRINDLFSGAKPNQQGVRILDRGDALDLAGYGDMPVVLNERHAVVEGADKHPLPKWAWMKMPEWLDNPAAIFERAKDGHLTMIAPEKVNGHAVVIGLAPDVGPGHGFDTSRHLVLTAFAKDSGTMPAKSMVERGDLVPKYVDQGKGPSFYDGSGVQFPGNVAELRAFGRTLKTNHDLVKYRATKEAADRASMLRAGESRPGAGISIPGTGRPGQQVEPHSVEDLARKLSRAFGRDVKVKRVPPPTPQASALAMAVKRMFGRNVMFVESDDAGMSGVHIGGKNLFINARTKRPYAQVVGHELLHSLRTERPELYAKLFHAIKGAVDPAQSKAYRARLDAIYERDGLPKLSGNKATEELLADITGNHIADPEFLRQLQKVLEPSVYRRILAHLADFLAKAHARITGAREAIGNQQFLLRDQVEQAGRSVLDVLRELGDGQTAEDRRIAAAMPAWQRVFHGSPHRGIEATGFKLNKIGTGEGNQAYGYGMYFAGRRDVAEQYRHALTNGRATGVGAHDLALRKLEAHGGDAEKARADLADMYRRGVGAGLREQADRARDARNLLLRPEELQGQTYRADIPQDSELLDWDKPLSEQPEGVRKALQAYRDTGAPSSVDGKMVYAELQKPFVAKRLGYSLGDNPARAASDYLNSLGIPGLRYLDGGSRGNGDGTHNYVIWDESRLTPENAKIEAMFARGDSPFDDSRKVQEDPRAAAQAMQPGIDMHDGELVRRIGRGSIGHAFAVLDRVNVQTAHALRGWRNTFDRMMADKDGQKHIDASVDEWESGKPVSDPKLAPFFKSMKQAFDQRVDAIRATGRTMGYLQNYFPHLYKDPEKAKDWMAIYLSHRPFEGTKGWTRQRVYETLQAAREAGLEPMFNNPADMMQAHLAQLDKYIALHQVRTDLNARQLVMDENPNALRKPAGWAKVDDPAFRGKLIPQMIANDIHTTLGPGLRDVGAIRLWMNTKNSLVSLQLGLSAFHATMTTGDTVASHLSDAILRTLMGDGKGAVKSLVDTVTSPVLSPLRGHKLAKQALHEEAADAQTSAILRMLEQGGQRVQMSLDDHNQSYQQLAQLLRQGAWRKGYKGTAETAWRAAQTLAENITPLIHEYLVPAQKMTAKVLGMKMELDRVAKRLGQPLHDYSNMESLLTEDAIRQIASRVVNHVDDRLGQRNYRNLYLNRKVLDGMQMAVMSPGWQIGSFNTLVGGASDVVHLLGNKADKLGRASRFTGDNLIRGQVTKAGDVANLKLGPLTDRLAYLVALQLLVAGVTTGITYAVTGTGPQDVRDFYTIRTGRTNPDGTAERLSFPSYIRDEAELMHGITHNPLAPFSNLKHMAGNKLSPVARMLGNLASNRDWRGNEIILPSASATTKIEQVAHYVAQQGLPFAIEGMFRSHEAGGGVAQDVANTFGFNPAPGQMTRTPFFDILHEHSQDPGHVVLTPEQAKASDAFYKQLSNARVGRPVDFSKLTIAQRHKLAVYRRTSAPEAAFKRLSIGDKLEAYRAASPAERERYHLKRWLLNTKTGFTRLNQQERMNVFQDLRDVRAGREPSVMLDR